MNRIKVINEPSDLVTMLRAMDTETKMEVFKEVSQGWKTTKEIKKKYGAEGKKALIFFEKMRLVETKWQSTDGSQPEKAYHTYYTSFHINTSCPVTEISDVLAAAVMDPADFKKVESRIYRAVGNEGKFAGDINEKLKITPTMLKALVKRSTRLEYRGHRVERYKE